MGIMAPVDRRLDPQTRWNRDRRIASGPRLAKLLVTSERLTFEELVEAAAPADTADVATWLSHAVQGGLIEEIEPDPAHPVRAFRLRRTDAERRWARRVGDA